MSNLEFVKLNTVCTRITDGSHYSPKGITEGYPMLSVKDMLHHGFSYDDCKYISEEDYNDMLKSDCVPLVNDVLIAKDGSYLKHVFVIKEERKQGILSSIGILRPNLKKINPEYLKYYLHSNSVKETVAKKYVSGSALPRIILKNFGEIDVIYKPLITQQKIAKVLSDLDAKIELNNRINSELEAMAKTLYDYWFVQFDFPYSPPSEGCPQDGVGIGMPYKTSGGKMVWNAKLKREIPEGWEVKKIEEVATIKAGGDKPKVLSSEKNKTNTIPIYSNGITNDGLYGYTDQAKINSQSITISARGTIGFCVLRDKPFVPIIRLIVIIPNSSYEVKYFFETVKNIAFEKSGSVQQQLTVPQVSQLDILYPPTDLLKKFDKATTSGICKIELIKEENQELASLRDWLLPMLMNGQVSVGDDAEELGMVAEESARYGK